MFKQKKAQTNTALISGLVFGVAFLVIGAIIAFVVVSTLSNANLLTEGRASTTITNESDYVAESVFMNSTGYTLDSYSATDSVPTTFTIVSIYNGTVGLVPAANYSLTNGLLNSTSTAANLANVTITYTFQNYTAEEKTTNKLSSNFTTGVNNISDKIPTVLLVAAIVLILGILVLLVAAWQRMRLGGGGI